MSPFSRKDFRREREEIKARQQTPLARQNYLGRRQQQANKKRDAARQKAGELQKQLATLQVQHKEASDEAAKLDAEGQRLGSEIVQAAGSASNGRCEWPVWWAFEGQALEVAGSAKQYLGATSIPR